ncbi:hypothetical protein D8B26_004419 [Coccidioides posadasii str. Silveira]|uniref:uncharacterized protein n=1 Tax=Coccidioides posadasii (strain RMSCC 757 / Silveira) TaxID=443226 RepID=UPI001BEDED26|nr:hypothetical protein D8B26_004419 [Coccidioides posadasii str. Silveira]
MAHHSHPAGPDNKGSKSQSNVISVLDAIVALEVSYSDSRYESSTASKNKDDDEGQLPTKHYLALAESLNITQLQQKQYSPNTQEKLDETHDYWKR